MKIKPAPHKKLIRSQSYHYWLTPEQPRKKGRLAQLTKWNTKLRTSGIPSEFILMARSAETATP